MQSKEGVKEGVSVHTRRVSVCTVGGVAVCTAGRVTLCITEGAGAP